MGRHEGSYAKNTNLILAQILSSLSNEIASKLGGYQKVIDMPRPYQGVSFYGNGFYKFFGSPGAYNFVVPEGVSSIRVRIGGAGGGGAALSRTEAGGVHCQGGGGGGYAIAIYTGLTQGQVLPLSVGLGGVGGAASTGVVASSPTNGGNSTFNSDIIATGGAFGKYFLQGNPSDGSGAGGTVQGGLIRFSGGSAGSLLNNSYNNLSASGGGAAASFLGNGYNSGDVYDFASGGGGVGGSSIGSTTIDMVAGPGGGSFGASFSRTESSTVIRYPGKGLYDSIIELQLVNSGILLPRFDGDILLGSGGLARNAITFTEGSLTGGSGAGGGGLYLREPSTASKYVAGDGGPFGGGGAAIIYHPSGSGYSVYGGNGGVCAGGGGAVIGYSSSGDKAYGGNGGHGFVLIEY